MSRTVTIGTLAVAGLLVAVWLAYVMRGAPVSADGPGAAEVAGWLLVGGALGAVVSLVRAPVVATSTVRR